MFNESPNIAKYASKRVTHDAWKRHILTSFRKVLFLIGHMLAVRSPSALVIVIVNCALKSVENACHPVVRVRSIRFVHKSDFKDREDY